MQKNQYKIVERIEETHDVVTLRLAQVDGKPFTYVSGQFITVYFPESGTPEGKSYSLSSAPSEASFAITVKSMGEFSHKLCSLKIGDEITASLPYGFFYSESTASDKVMIAGGIGIAPFRSMIVDAVSRLDQNKIILNYSVRTSADIIFKNELDALAKENPHFNVNYFLTREQTENPAHYFGRIEPSQIVKNLDNLKAPEFFLCGSISFVRDMWKGLRECGVPEEVIFTEAFFSH